MKNNKLFALSVAALLGFGTVGSLGIRAFNKKASVAGNQIMAESTKCDEVGNAISFGNHILRAGESDEIASDIGVQVIEGSTEGTKSLRFIAALSGYKGLESATWTRSPIYDGETLIKPTSTFEVDSVYTSIANAESIKWQDTLDTKYGYYMVYTLANIPAAFDYSTITVSFTAKAVGADAITPIVQEAAVAGVEGAPKFVGASYRYNDETGEWRIYRDAANVKVPTGDLVIPEDWYETDGYKVIKHGKVTGAMKENSYGAFEGASNLKSITWPATLTRLENWAMASTNIKKTNLPRDLVFVESSFLPSSNMDEINWEAKNLTIGGFFRGSVSVVNVSKDVESLPSTNVLAYPTSYSIGRVNYEGTTAEWEALMAAYPNCGLNIDNVWCSDTTTNTVTFNPNGGAFKDVEGSVEKTVISGKVVEDPGKPKMAGKTFVGWFTEAVGGTEVDITLATSADATYYAHYVDLIGNTLENSIKVSTTGEKSVALDSELQAAYVEFTAPATDRYYIEIDTKKSKITGKYTNTYNNTVTDRTDSSYATVQLLDAEGNVTFNDGTPSGSITNLTPDPIATVAGNKTVVIIDATAGAKYNLKLVGSYYATFNQVEGDLYYNIYTEENDTTATATEIEKGEKYNLGGWAHSSTNFVYKTYSYTPEESYSGVLKFKRTGYPYGSWEVYEEGTAAPIAKASSYSDGVVASIDYKAGKQYTFAFISTVELSSSVALEFSIEDAPAGSSIGNAIADVVVADGDAVKIERNGTMYTWYKLVVADDGTYKFSIDKFSSSYSYSGVCEVYDSTGTTKINGVTGKSGSSTFNADLTAGTYYVKTGFSSTSYMSTTYELSVVYLAPGADRTSPITTTLIDDTANGETFSLKGSAKGTWYKFRRADNSTFDIALVNPEEGASAKFYSGSSTTVSMDLTETPAKMSLRSTTTDYYVCVVSPTGGNVTFSKAVHIGEYTNAEENGFYEGRALADTYSSWHWYLGDDGYVWDPNTLTSAATATEVKPNVTTDETSGYKLWTNQGNSLEKIYTDGDMAFGVKQYSATGTVYAYAASKNCTGVDGSLGFKTASLSTTSGTIIGFLPTESGYEIGAMIDGHVYLNCTYEMIEGDNAHTKDATFKIKSSEGYTVGAYQVTKAEGTATWKMVITPIEFEPDAPEGPSEEPTVPGYVGTWEGEDGTIIINADGTGSITEGEGVANFKYEIDADGDLSLTDFDGDDYYEGLVQYNAETCAFSAYVYGNESYFELEMTKPSETPTDPTPETPAAPAYCGTYSKGSNTCIINADGTGSWNGYAFTYTYNEATKTFDVSNFGAFDDDENKFILSEDGSSLSVNLSGGYGDNVYIDVLAKA